MNHFKARKLDPAEAAVVMALVIGMHAAGKKAILDFYAVLVGLMVRMGKWDE